MKLPTAALMNKLANASPVQLAIGAAIVVGVVYLLLRQTGKAVGDAAAAVVDAGAGVVTGDNAITRGTPYEGAGIFGTLGGAVNAGVPILDDIGGWLGRTIYDWTHDPYDPNAPVPTSGSRKTNLRM